MSEPAREWSICPEHQWEIDHCEVCSGKHVLSKPAPTPERVARALDALVAAVIEANAQDFKCEPGWYTETHMHPEDWQAIAKAATEARAALAAMRAPSEGEGRVAEELERERMLARRAQINRGEA